MIRPTGINEELTYDWRFHTMRFPLKSKISDLDVAQLHFLKLKDFLAITIDPVQINFKNSVYECHKSPHGIREGYVLNDIFLKENSNYYQVKWVPKSNEKLRRLTFEEFCILYEINMVQNW